MASDVDATTRTWCCHSQIGQPHTPGCRFEPKPTDWEQPDPDYTYRLRVLSWRGGYQETEFLDTTEAFIRQHAERTLARPDVWYVDLARRPRFVTPPWETLISTNKQPRLETP